MEDVTRWEVVVEKGKYNKAKINVIKLVDSMIVYRKLFLIEAKLVCVELN